MDRKEFKIVVKGDEAEVKRIRFENGYKRERRANKKELLDIVQMALSKVPR